MDGADVKARIREGEPFASPFASALIKLSDAERNGEVVYLEAAEVRAVMDGFRLLRRPRWAAR